jgi:hypothetical protein
MPYLLRRYQCSCGVTVVVARVTAVLFRPGRHFALQKRDGLGFSLELRILPPVSHHATGRKPERQQGQGADETIQHEQFNGRAHYRNRIVNRLQQ